MKKGILVIVVLLGLCISGTVNAQVNVQVNIGRQPVWGPVGYDYVDYYYMPDIEAYYSVPRREYVYYNGGTWITTRALPARYSNFYLYNAHKVVINDPTPWKYHDRYRSQYGKYKGQRDQIIIRDSHEERYFVNPGHPQHGKWKGNKGQGNSGHGNKAHGNPRMENNSKGNNGHGNGGGKGHGNGHGNKGK